MITIRRINMKSPKIRYSKQRELILSNLKNRYDHPTAEMIYQDLKKENPHLSLGTVYRNLNQLCETKLINKIDVGNPMVHYDGNTDPHIHFICQQCGQIIDIDIDENSIVTQFQNHLHHHIKKIQIQMSGICQNCSQDQAA